MNVVGQKIRTNNFREQAGLLKLMAHPVRLQILEVLNRDPECVCHLSAVLKKSQPYVSQQLAVLRNAGIIVDQKEGTNVFYGIANSDAGRRARAVLRPLAGESSATRQTVDGCPCPKCGPGSC